MKSVIEEERMDMEQMDTTEGTQPERPNVIVHSSEAFSKDTKYPYFISVAAQPHTTKKYIGTRVLLLASMRFSETRAACLAWSYSVAWGDGAISHSSCQR